MRQDIPSGSASESRSVTHQVARASAPGGFSILELMIAMLVLLFGFLAMANLIATSIVVNRSSNRLTSLTQLASDKLEELRSLDPNDPRVQAGGSLDINLTQTVGGHTEPYYDSVYVDQRSGAFTVTTPPDDSGVYSSVTRNLDGTTSPPSTSGSEPAKVSYRRRWTVQKDTPIALATKIVVEVAVKTNKLSDADPPATGNNFRQVIRMTAVR
jgi:type II secretory pathway pseudopilin PulG